MWRGARIGLALGVALLFVGAEAAAGRGRGKAARDPGRDGAGPATPQGEGKPRLREQVEVAGVIGGESGQYVVLLRTQHEPLRYLPLWVGEVEAINIRLRLQRQKPPRPLTLHLLESILASGHIELTEIAIDDVQGGVFLGTLSLRQNGREWRIDARPSDAIGLALGQGVPIWVTRQVIDNAAVDPKTLGQPPNGNGAGAGAAKAAGEDLSETL